MGARLLLLLLCPAVLAKLAQLSFSEWSARTGSNDRELYQAYDAKVQRQLVAVNVDGGPQEKRPRSALDVVKVSWDGFSTAGLLGFGWTLAVKCKEKLPLAQAAKAAKWNGVRWGFAGGSALAALTLNRSESDKVCAMVGAVFGGAAAASSLSEMPSSIATFVGFSYLLNILSEKTANMPDTVNR